MSHQSVTADLDKIAIIDFGGQYAHLIGSRIRSLGVYTEIWHTDLEEYRALSDAEQAQFKGIIFSGGPQSVYDGNAPAVDKAVYDLGLPILGICYGHQRIMQDLGGTVERADHQEYGPAEIHLAKTPAVSSAGQTGPGAATQSAGLFPSNDSTSHRVWMSHGDQVVQLPPGFVAVASSKDCQYAAVAHNGKHIYGVQFHPEVTHTPVGPTLLTNFLDICGVNRNWSLSKFLEKEIEDIRQHIDNRRIFLLVSGGVDSTVAFVVLAKACGAENIYPLIVDTGFMRAGEIDDVRQALAAHNLSINVYDAKQKYYSALEGVYAPEEKRKIIGALFIDIQKEVSEQLGLNPDEWLLGQGTIYPDTIESGGTKHAALIKTHHNRVPEVEELIRQGKVVEPLRELYKNEVRELGTMLGLPDNLVHRQPFPGPGLGVRILNVAPADVDKLQNEVAPVQKKLNAFLHDEAEQSRLYTEQLGAIKGKVLPIRSVGVKGDNRSYEHPAVLYIRENIRVNWPYVDDLATEIGGKLAGVNRVLVSVWGGPQPGEPSEKAKLHSADANANRVALLQAADKIVNDFQKETKLEEDIWQFPVCLLPLWYEHSAERREALVLRPVQSSEAMTVNFYPMAAEHLQELVTRLSQLDWVSEILYDVTNKPPGTIEWE